MNGHDLYQDHILKYELDRFYFPSNGNGLNLEPKDKLRVLVSLEKMWNLEEICFFGKSFKNEDIKDVFRDLMKPRHILLALKVKESFSEIDDIYCIGASVFMFALYEEDFNAAIKEGKIRHSQLPLVVASFLSEAVFYFGNGYHTSKIKIELSNKEKKDIYYPSLIHYGNAREPDSRGNYFIMPNSIFELGLSGGAILLYACLLSFENRKTHTCYPKFGTISDEVGMSKNTIRKYLDELEKIGLVDTSPTYQPNNGNLARNGVLRYHFNSIIPIKEEYDKRNQNAFLAQAKAQKRISDYNKKHENQISVT